MTSRLARRNYGNGHGYALDGRKVPGVTTIIGKLDKPALIDWAARMAAGYAVDHWDELSRKPILERAKLIQDARWIKNKQAIVKGNRLHWFAERLQADGEVAVPDELLGQVQAVQRFLDRWQLTTLHSETPCFSTESQYAGTLDSIMASPLLGNVLVDWKSGDKVYGEVALQFAGYQNCDFLQGSREVVGPRGGKKAPDTFDIPMPQIDGCYVAHILGDDVELLPVRVGDAEIATFLYLREVYDWLTTAIDRNSDDYAPPVGEAIYPEQVA